MTLTNEQIAFMKENRVPLKWLEAEQITALMEAKKHNAMVFMDSKGYWQRHKGQESQGVVYRISKSYQPPAEKPYIPEKLTGNSNGEYAVNKLIDCVKYIYEEVESLKKV